MGKACSVPVILVLLAFLSSIFLVHAAVAGGSRRALLPREGASIVDVSGGQALPTRAEEMAMGGELPLLVDDEEMVARRVDLQTQDYPGSGANGRHDPRNPH